MDVDQIVKKPVLLTVAVNRFDLLYLQKIHYARVMVELLLLFFDH